MMATGYPATADGVETKYFDSFSVRRSDLSEMEPGRKQFAVALWLSRYCGYGGQAGRYGPQGIISESKKRNIRYFPVLSCRYYEFQ